MAKIFFQKTIVFIVALGFIILLCLASGMDTDLLIQNLVFFGLFAWSIAILDDPIAKIFWYRYAITKEYLGMMALYIAALVSFTVSYCTDIFWLGLTSAILFVPLQGGAFFLYWYFYSKHQDKYRAFEIERAKWIKYLSKFKDMTATEIETKAYAFLRFYTKRGILESNLALSKPVDKTGKLRTVTQMLAENPYDTDALEAQKKIKEMVSEYCQTHQIKEGK